MVMFHVVVSETFRAIKDSSYSPGLVDHLEEPSHIVTKTRPYRKPPGFQLVSDPSEPLRAKSKVPQSSKIGEWDICKRTEIGTT